MAVSHRTSWIAAGLLARLLTIVVLLMSVRFNLANYLNLASYNPANNTVYTYRIDFKLRSYRYAVASGILGLAGSLLQIPVAIYLLCKSSSMMPSVVILDISMYADMVTSLVLASGVGAGFGATDDALRYVHASEWKRPSDKPNLIDYYKRGIVAVVFLLVGTILCICATVVSTRLRARASKGHAGDV